MQALMDYRGHTGESEKKISIEKSCYCMNGKNEREKGLEDN